MNNYHSNEMFRAMTAVLDEYGVSYHVENGSKHPKIVFSIGGRRRSQTFSRSGGIGRAIENAAAQMRRLLEEATSPTDIVGDTIEDVADDDTDGVDLSALDVVSGFAPGQPLTMSSLEIAELTGKDHRNVMRDIRNMLQALGIPNALSFERVYTDTKGERRPCYDLPKRECLILVSGYSITLRAKIIDRWQELEDALAAKVIEERIGESRRAMQSPAAAPEQLTFPMMSPAQAVSLSREGLRAVIGGTSNQIAAHLKRDEFLDGISSRVCDALADGPLEDIIGAVTQTTRGSEEATRHSLQAIACSLNDLRKYNEDRWIAIHDRDKKLILLLKEALGLINKSRNAFIRTEFCDYDDIYRLAGLTGKIVKRSWLTNIVSASLQSHCRRNRIFVEEMSVRGANVLFYPLSAVRQWLDAGGREMIDRHVARQGMKLALVSTGGSGK